MTVTAPVPTSSTPTGQTSATPLEVKNLSVRFGTLTAVDDVSLKVNPGAFVGLIGPNGAGKTTCFNAITGFVKPAAGTIDLFGKNVTSWPSYRRARFGAGRNFQNIGMDKSESLVENLWTAIEVGPLSHEFRGFGRAMVAAKDSAWRRRERSKLTETIEMLGIERHLGTVIGDLPIGITRLGELACVLLREPRLLLLDEPSSGLSINESERLLDALRQVRAARGASLLVVEHDMRFIMKATEYIYVLNFGQLLAEGTPEAVRSNAAVVEAYLGNETRGQ